MPDVKVIFYRQFCMIAKSVGTAVQDERFKGLYLTHERPYGLVLCTLGAGSGS